MPHENINTVQTILGRAKIPLKNLSSVQIKFGRDKHTQDFLLGDSETWSRQMSQRNLKLVSVEHSRGTTAKLGCLAFFENFLKFQHFSERPRNPNFLRNRYRKFVVGCHNRDRFM